LLSWRSDNFRLRRRLQTKQFTADRQKIIHMQRFAQETVRAGRLRPRWQILARQSSNHQDTDIAVA
jgi:hypothetical protein